MGRPREECRRLVGVVAEEEQRGGRNAMTLTIPGWKGWWWSVSMPIDGACQGEKELQLGAFVGAAVRNTTGTTGRLECVPLFCMNCRHNSCQERTSFSGRVGRVMCSFVGQFYDGHTASAYHVALCAGYAGAKDFCGSSVGSDCRGREPNSERLRRPSNDHEHRSDQRIHLLCWHSRPCSVKVLIHIMRVI
jgi:hypothetical protein